MNANSATKPRMMPIKNLAKNGTVGGCLLLRLLGLRPSLVRLGGDERPVGECKLCVGAGLKRFQLESLSADIAHEHWLASKEARELTTTSAAKLPILNTEQLAPTWRSAEPLLVIGARTELDQAAAAIFAALVEMHGVPARVECAEMLTACNIANLDLSGVALMCVSSVDMKTPAHIHFAARRLRSRAPHAKLLLGLWSAKDDETGAELKDVVGTDDFARTFHQAAAIILQRATTDQGGAKAPARASAALA